MANNVTRITANGNFYITGNFDEISYNPNLNCRNLAYPADLSLWTRNYDVALPTIARTTDTLAPDGSSNTAVKWTNTTPSTWIFPPYNTIVYQLGKQYTFSVYAKAGTGFQFSIVLYGSTYAGESSTNLIVLYDLSTNTATNTTGSAGVIDSYGITPVGNGWYRCWMTTTNRVAVNFQTHQNIRAVYSNSYMYFWGYQVEQGTLTDYIPTSNNGAVANNFTFRTTQTGNYYATSFIDEISQHTGPSQKNLIYPTTTLTTGWSATSSGTGTAPVITPNYDYAPDGTLTATRVDFASGGNGNSQLAVNGYNTPSNVYNTTYTFSVWLKYISGDFLITPYNVTSISIPWIVTNQWQRFSYTSTNFTPTNGGIRLAKREIWTSGGTGSFLIWGPQLEAGTVATDYAATDTSGNVVATFAKRDTSNGVSMVTSQFNEVNGVLNQVTDSSLILNLDAAKTESYPGTGTIWYDTTPNKLNFTMLGNLTWNYSSQSFFGNLVNGNLSFYNDSADTRFDSTSFTMEIWFKQISVNTNGKYWNVLSYKENYGISGFRFGIDTNTNLQYPSFWTDQSGGNISITSSTNTVVGNWYQAVVTYDLTSLTCKIYVNGVLTGTQTSATYLPPVGRRFNIFATNNGMYSMNGYMGNFMWYNRALSASEVAQNFNAIRGRYGI